MTDRGNKTTASDGDADEFFAFQADHAGRRTKPLSLEIDLRPH